MSDTIYLSLGSNLGDKESNIASCIAMLGSYIENTEIRWSTTTSKWKTTREKTTTESTERSRRRKI